MNMAQAKIRYNPDHSLVEFAPPEGDEYGPMDTENELVVLADPDAPGRAFVAVLEDGYPGLKANTIYQLTEVATITEDSEDVTIEEDDEEEDDEEAEEMEMDD
jgi:hypothetical protein